MASTRVVLNTGKMRKMVGETIYSVCKTSTNRKKLDDELGKSSLRLLSDFDAHLVTQEIAGGPKGASMTETLGGYGNLFSFIGFPEGSDPLAPIRNVIAKQLFQIQRGGMGVLKSGNVVTLRIEGPTASQIFEVTDMPWAQGRSWAKGIEQGISGLGYYLNTEYKPESGNWRSGMGFQSDTKITRKEGASVPTKFKNTSYISEMIRRNTAEAVRSITSGGALL